MLRNVFKELAKWKNAEDRKPLIIKGARGVGKTWIMKELGEKEYENYVYFDFETQPELKTVFKYSKDPYRIVEKLSLIASVAITPGKTLIILDEIQECGEALTSLKYFNEEANEYHVITASSFPEAYISEPVSYPVGKVDIVRMYPMTFDEFLKTTDSALFKIYNLTVQDKQLNEIFCKRLEEAYDKYLIIGGMPECINSWIKYHDPQKVNLVQKNLLEIYRNDIVKHNRKITSTKIFMILDNIVSQLTKENKKFMYGKIKFGSRRKEFEEAIRWLQEAGLINVINNVTENEYPLRVYTDLNAFKIYFFDTGLLKHMAGIENRQIILHKKFIFKEALTENYVLQQILDQFYVEPKYFTFDRHNVDFMVQKDDEIIPIKVQRGKSVSSPDLSRYKAKFNPKIMIRYSTLGYKRDDDLINIPLYLARLTNKLIS